MCNFLLDRKWLRLFLGLLVSSPAKVIGTSINECMGGTIFSGAIVVILESHAFTKTVRALFTIGDTGQRRLLIESENQNK